MRGILQVVLLLVLLPAVVTAVLLQWGGGGRVARGAQPGGVVRGVLKDPSGAPLAGEPVVALAVSPLGATSELSGSATSDLAGRWALELPPLDGGYLLRLGGRSAVALEQAVSLIGREPGEEPRELELVLQRGATLVVELPRELRGRWLVEGQPAGGAFGLFAGSPWRKEGEFEGRAFRVEGAPPMDARILVRVEGGERWEWTLRLAAGDNQLAARD